MGTAFRLRASTTREILDRSTAAVTSEAELAEPSKVARHVALAEPVLHPWHLTLRPSPLAVFLGVGAADARRVARGDAWVVLDGGGSRLRPGRVLPRGAAAELLGGFPRAKAGTFSEALEALWTSLDRASPVAEGASQKSRARALRQRLWLRDHGAAPASLLLGALPVVPSRSLAPPLARRYRAVLRADAALRANRTDAARRALAVAVHAAWAALAERAATPPPPASTGAAVTMTACVPDPTLAPGECGLPEAVLRALLGRRVHDWLVATGRARDLLDAAELLDAEPEALHDAIDALCASHPVLLVRERPTLAEHVVALRPVARDGEALRVHPARIDHFTGVGSEQRPVHVLMPATRAARDELRRLAGGDRHPLPSGAALLGLYVATRESRSASPPRFASADAVEAAHAAGALGLRDEVLVRAERTTAGRALVGRALPDALRPDGWNRVVTKKVLRDLAAGFERVADGAEADEAARRLWELGAMAVGRHGVSLCAGDLGSAPGKREIVASAMEMVAKVDEQYLEGVILDSERYNKVVDIWADVGSRLAQAHWEQLSREPAVDPSTGRAERVPSFNPLFIMADSGARGSPQQGRQLGAMRGLMAAPGGDIFETPILHGLREGVTPHEFMVGAFGARRGLLKYWEYEAKADDVLLRLARLLAPVRVTEDDCGTTEGTAVTREPGTFEESHFRFLGALPGRTLLRDVVDPATGAVLARAGSVLDKADAGRLYEAGVEEVAVRGPATCLTRRGVCRACMGADGARGQRVGLAAALAVGHHARQVFGLRTFHVGC